MKSLSSEQKAVIFHTLEVVISFSLPLLINYLLETRANEPMLVGLGGLLSAVAKALRDAGVLPDYISTAPTAAQPVDSIKLS